MPIVVELDHQRLGVPVVPVAVVVLDVPVGTDAVLPIAVMLEAPVVPVAVVVLVVVPVEVVPVAVVLDVPASRFVWRFLGTRSNGLQTEKCVRNILLCEDGYIFR